MDKRFADLKKLPKDPARRLLALGNAKLSVPLSGPAAAATPEVLDELAAQEAFPDMLRLLSVALPVREAVWWACLAAGDVLGDAAPPPPLVAARAWVFKPNDETREAARRALETAEPEDETTLVATAVTMHDGKLGTGEMAKFDAPPGVAATAVFGMVVTALTHGDADGYRARADLLVDRALDIARGGNGQLDSAGTAMGEKA